MKMGPFPDEVFAFRADTPERASSFATPLYDEREIQRRVTVYAAEGSVMEIRVAKYRLESVEVAYSKEAKP